MKALVVQNIAIEGPGFLQPEMERAGWELELRIMDQPNASLPGTLNGYQALLILGGPMNVYEEGSYAYLRQVDQLIKAAVKEGLPVLGICLGGQLIAKALGAPVTRNQVQEIGWYKLRLTAEGLKSPLFKGLSEEFPVFQWHGDTFALPDGSKHLATTSDCAHQAFSFGQRIFALQFHLEVTPAIIEAWAKAYADELAGFSGAGAIERLVAETKALWREYEQVAACFLKNWVGIMSKV